MSHSSYRAVALKFLFGLLAPFIGLFFGLQVSPLLANVLMFPFIIVSALTGTPTGTPTGMPIGEMSGLLFTSLVLVSGVAWAGLLSIPTALRKLNRMRGPTG